MHQDGPQATWLHPDDVGNRNQVVGAATHDKKKGGQVWIMEDSAVQMESESL